MNVRMPAEWAEQEWIWIGFPHAADLWLDDLLPAQEQMAAFADTVAESGQEVRLVVRDATSEARARELVRSAVKFERHAYGDIWLRDSGPLVLFDESDRRIARRFGFNGWGGKFIMEGDQEIGETLAAAAGLPGDEMDWILEGGAIDTDGTGLVVTTEQCLLNTNRNPRLDKAEIEARLRDHLGFDRVLWLGEGLLGDHTDGHVDNLARFVAPGVLALPVASGADDPNAAIYADARDRARVAGLEVREVPSPGLVTSGDIVEPASYMNFVIANDAVIVPIFGLPWDAQAVEALGAMFPTRTAIGVLADAVLAGGGGFHCASQHMPDFD